MGESTALESSNYSGKKMNDFGIELKPLTLETAELLRNWVNQTWVQKYFDLQGEISAKTQEKWFRSLDPKRARYFILFQQEIPFGMIHLKDIDPEQKTAESGLLIGEPSFLGTGITLGASLLLLDLAFENLALEWVFAKVHTENEKALQYNHFLGFEFDQALETSFIRLKITKKKYQANRDKLIRFISQ